uniref:Endonuclease V n=1 Tax=Cyprinus carpio carpio TaxID=630221 RepID=A0A9J8DET6_CYPCA
MSQAWSSLFLLSFQGSSIGLEIGEWCRCCSLSIAPPGSVRSRGSRPHPTRHIYPHRPSQTGVYPRECSLLTLRGAVTVAMAYLGVLFVDGNGLFHYREFGLACHLGVLSDLPCVGVAKNLLHVEGVVRSEEHQSQINALQKSGDSFPLATTSGRVLGKALRSSHSSIKPVYVSVGHRITLDTAVRLTHTCCLYRVPEPIRQTAACDRQPAKDTDLTDPHSTAHRGRKRRLSTEHRNPSRWLFFPAPPQ